MVQRSRKIHVEDPICQSHKRQLANLVLDSSILIETVGGGVRVLPHCVMGLFLQQARLLFQMKLPSS